MQREDLKVYNQSRQSKNVPSVTDKNLKKITKNHPHRVLLYDQTSISAIEQLCDYNVARLILR